MNTYFVLLCAFLLLAITETAKADGWVLAPGKGSVSPDKAFSDQLGGYLSIDCGPWTALKAVENPEAIPTAGKTFVSPDQRFSVQTTIADRELYFVIKDAQTGSVSRLPSDCFPILALEWSPDSKTILAIAHASMTSLIELIHWDGSRWLHFEIDDPENGENDKFHVVGWEFKTGYIQATYIIDNRAANGRSLDLYRCTFHVDPTNGKTSEVVKTPITLKEFVSLRNGLN
jgi:hypothetical protein